MLYFLGAIALILLAIVLFLNFNPQFGGRIDKQEKDKLSKSPQWNGKVFEN